MGSPFLRIPRDEWVASNELAFAIRDAFPVTRGHTLIVTKREVATWFDASVVEQRAVLDLVGVVKLVLDRELAPDGYNIGVNVGAAAGQTVGHLHMHVIPRFAGDVPDPRGGVRWVIPERANFLKGGVAGPGVDIGTKRLYRGEDDSIKQPLLRCLRDREFDKIEIIVSFVLRRGLELLFPGIEDALDRGAHLRVLTSNYLQVTEPDALARLLDLVESLAIAGSTRLQVKVFDASRSSFHPKAYLFRSTGTGKVLGFVGSSNVSATGLDGGIEWNLQTSNLDELLRSFERHWIDPRSLSLTRSWLSTYQGRPRPQFSGEAGMVAEPQLEFGPRQVQIEALAALVDTRAAGFHAGLVVMATGLGKTWLAAFDAQQLGARRVLFVAHRDEILKQTLDVFRKVRPAASLGLYTGTDKTRDTDVVFASIQTLGRRLNEFAADEFDYVVVDEFHHAAAQTYRKVLDHFSPKFLLGLTATPERMDGADLLALCGDNVVFRCDLVDGIRRGDLVPFHYFGVKDSIDFAPIPWRNGRFDPAELAKAVETHERAEQSYREWKARAGTRTLAFCCSIEHAEFTRQFFATKGVRVAAVHTDPRSAPRREALEQLRRGDIDVVFSVDVFNEGVDVPELDTVLMLRPTESPTIFLQQLGRGSRRCDDPALAKKHLTVIDFIGNHRSFLIRPKTLLGLGGGCAVTGQELLRAVREGDFGLPEGCQVHYELDSIDVFEQLLRREPGNALEGYCREYFESESVRPSAAQVHAAGYEIGRVRRQGSGWFDFLAGIGLLAEPEQQALSEGGDFLRALEVEPMNKSFKMVVLKAMLHEGKLLSGMSIEQLAETSHAIMRADPRLVADVTGKEMPDVVGAEKTAWLQYWRKWPVAAWLGELRDQEGRWFVAKNGRFEPTFRASESCADAFAAAVAELVEFKLSRYLAGKFAGGATGGQAVGDVRFESGKLLVKFERAAKDLPLGQVPMLAAGESLIVDFDKRGMRSAHRAGEKGDALLDVLRQWFGPTAGYAGTRHQVVLETDGGKWTMRPKTVAAVEATNLALPFYPEYAAACGAFGAVGSEQPQGVRAIAKVSGLGGLDPNRDFVVRARGDSLDGGAHAIRHGDYVVLQWARGVDLRQLVDQVVLADRVSEGSGGAALKWLRRNSRGGYELHGAKPGFEPIPGTNDMHVVASFVRTLQQAEFNPLWTNLHQRLRREQVPALFGEVFDPGNWNSGHVSLAGAVVLFVTLEKSEAMAHGAGYDDRVIAEDTLVWSSQTSTGPSNKRGKELVAALDSDLQVHVFVRGKKSEVQFLYAGMAVLVSHEGARPMRVTWRLFDPLPREVFLAWREKPTS